MTHDFVTTAFTLDGFRITHNLGLVRGIIVRSRSIFGTLGASLQTIVGGNITLLTDLCEKTREQAFEKMVSHAVMMGRRRCDRRPLRRHRSDAGCHRSPVLWHRGAYREDSCLTLVI